jgi:hypothetical protein
MVTEFTLSLMVIVGFIFAWLDVLYVLTVILIVICLNWLNEIILCCKTVCLKQVV